MSVMKTSRLSPIALTVVALALTTAACAVPAEAKRQKGNRTEPFSSRIERGDGAAVVWSGYAQGHRPGEESTFEITLHNGSQETWSGRYCIQLLDRHSALAALTQEEFSLQAGESWSGQVVVRFPDDLAEGAYGLALIIPGCFSSVTTIQVGNESDTYVGPWPEPLCS